MDGNIAAAGRLISRLSEGGGNDGARLMVKVGAAAGVCWVAAAHTDTIRKALLKSLKVRNTILTTACMSRHPPATVTLQEIALNIERCILRRFARALGG